MKESSAVWRHLIKRLTCSRIIRVFSVILVMINIFYISSLVIVRESSGYLSKKIKQQASSVLNLKSTEEHHIVSQEYILNLPRTKTVPTDYSTSEDNQELYAVPPKAYEDLNGEEKINYHLNKITEDKSEYWLADTRLNNYKLEINVDEFKKSFWKGNPGLFYDPRFTLSIYLSEIRNQLIEKENGKKTGDIVVPFSWSDWVDLTMLNEELSKDPRERKNCAYMKATHHEPAKNQKYCVDTDEITDKELKEMGFSSRNYIPGFAVRESPTNKASNEVRMLEGKSHLLTYALNPHSIFFMGMSGVYQAKVGKKQRIVDSDLFENFLTSHDVTSETLTLDPVSEYRELISKFEGTKATAEDELHASILEVQESKSGLPKNSHIPQSLFDFQTEKFDYTLSLYEDRFKELRRLTTNELIFDGEAIERIKLTREERNHYDGMKFSKKYKPKKEPTYFRMARLNFGNEENDVDAGWHYEWRFFNGALRYLKKGWNEEQLLTREKILLDRILRNWFRFANDRGIISWIAHGPLLAWYWDGLLFPFDEDIDIQMPIEELVKFSKTYNQSLIIEDMTEGFGKYFIDVSNFIYHRGKTYRNNHIDARFIDLDTGGFIDITGLGISDENVPDKYREQVDRAIEEGAPKPVYNCRNLHFYSHEELSPLRLTKIGGVPVYIPNKVKDILYDEYPTGLTSYEYRGYYFVDAINLWIHHSKLEFLFTDSKFKDLKGTINIEKFTNLVKAMSSEQVAKLLEHDQDILLEYYLTKKATDLHKEELTHLFEIPESQDGKFLISDVGDQKNTDDISTNEEYEALMSDSQLGKPFRRPLFNYEHIDRLKYHTV